MRGAPDNDMEAILPQRIGPFHLQEEGDPTPAIEGCEVLRLRFPPPAVGPSRRRSRGAALGDQEGQQRFRHSVLRYSEAVTAAG